MTASAFDHPWLGGLFGDAELTELWSAEHQLRHMLRFEAALTKALGEAELIAAEEVAPAVARIEAFAPDIQALAAATRRDGVVAPGLVRQLRQDYAAPAAIHTGATSQDVVDTALALTLQEVASTLSARIASLTLALNRLLSAHGAATIMGRTRMQAALPMAARTRIESWAAPLPELRLQLEQRRWRVQLGGPVGDRRGFGAHADQVAASVAQSLGLAQAPRAWHGDRSAVAGFGATLSQITGVLGKLGQDACLMVQQGVDDLAISGGGGSSAMPHKSNPVAAELLVTLARFNAAQLGALHSAMVHEQERSGAAWMLEWMVLPPMTVAAGRALSAASEVISQISRVGRPTG
ncbi:MAG: 3-carboxy-cis,cis-muconate cycloisomerase [Neomegalonema sp.]|nr:3-carboxy-cis,cis-muconate cycloisomerase [Neomegalonema sp.]